MKLLSLSRSQFGAFKVDSIFEVIFWSSYQANTVAVNICVCCPFMSRLFGVDVSNVLRLKFEIKGRNWAALMERAGAFLAGEAKQVTPRITEYESPPLSEPETKRTALDANSLEQVKVIIQSAGMVGSTHAHTREHIRSEELSWLFH